MSFLDTIIDVGKTAYSFLSGNSVGATLAKTALLGFATNKLSQSINPTNTATSGSGSSAAVDYGVRLQVNPDPTNKIPLVYGSAWLGGVISDAQESTDHLTMTYCFTICERTGMIMSTNTQSTFKFEDIYLNNNRVVFEEDGISVAYTTDGANIDYSAADLVKIYCYAGNSSMPVVPQGYTNGSLGAAYSIMPNWGMSAGMNDLIFALVQVKYNKSKGLTSVPEMKFHVTNTMSQPGDCLYDYMTNARYGAGIKPSEINA